MKLSKNALMILLSVCLTFEVSAQYSLMTRRQVLNEFDSAVTIEISEYRKIRKKVTTADSLIIALKAEVTKNAQLVYLNNTQAEGLKYLVQRHEDTIASKDKTIAELNSAFDELAALSKKFRIFRDPLPDTITKIFLGGAVGWGISKL
jgi:hypothetical protein